MFKIKDLMIKVIPDEAERIGQGDGIGGGGACGTYTCGCSDTCGSCSFVTCVGCSGCSPPSGGGLQPGTEVINPSDLLSLKADLKRRLSLVEAMEKNLAPQTLQEAEALERKLTEALVELKQIKAGFNKPSK